MPPAYLRPVASIFLEEKGSTLASFGIFFEKDVSKKTAKCSRCGLSYKHSDNTSNLIKVKTSI